MGRQGRALRLLTGQKFEVVAAALVLHETWLLLSHDVLTLALTSQIAERFCVLKINYSLL